MRRVLAVVGAIAMVAGAIVVRGRLDDHQVEQSQVYRLVCSSDLGPVCDEVKDAYDGRVDVTIEPAGTTADRLRASDEDPGLDGWLVADPWPAIVDGARQSASRAPAFVPGPAPIARSPLVIVAWKDRADALSSSCPNGKLEWKCLGAAAGRPLKDRTGSQLSNEVKVGHANPVTDGPGLLVLGQATADWFGTADLSTADLEQEEFQQWFSGLEGPANRSSDSPLGAMLTRGRAAYDAVGTTEADAVQVDTAAKRNDLVKIYPATMATADVVLAVTPGVGGERLRGLVGGRARKALTDAGWKRPETAGLPPGNGLPSPGLLDALRSRGREARR